MEKLIFSNISLETRFPDMENGGLIPQPDNCNNLTTVLLMGGFVFVVVVTYHFYQSGIIFTQYRKDEKK